MVTKKLTLLIFTVLILSNFGCSGSRLRNMVGRSEYSSLEDIEPQDPADSASRQGEALAKDSTRDRDGSLVSESRELDSADPVTVEKQRKGFLDFVKVFNRKSDTDEFAPDPFAESSSTTEIKTASTKPDSEISPEKRPAASVDNFSSTIAAVEKQSETFFDESLAKAKSAPFETEPATKTADDQPATARSENDSFADFVKQQTEAIPLVADVKTKATNAMHVVSATKNSAASEFDALLNEKTTAKELVAAADASSALFPGLSEEFDAAFQNSDAPQVPKSSQANVVVTKSNDEMFDAPFVEVAEKHGFSRDGGKDPWAVFAQRQSTETVAEAVQPAAQELKAKSENGFTWGLGVNSAPVDNEPEFPSSARQSHGSNGFQDPAFLQVSSTRPLETTPLMIPGGSVTDTSTQPAEFSNDPFLTSVPMFEATTGGTSVEGESAAAIPTVAASPGGLNQWSRRTWFLLIGCLIVALLIFMPDRRNRTNS